MYCPSAHQFTTDGSTIWAAFSSTSCEGKRVLSRVEVPNNWQRSLAISSYLNESIFRSLMSRTISCEWNGDSSFAYDPEPSPSLSHFRSCFKKTISYPVETSTFLQKQLTKANMNSNRPRRLRIPPNQYKIAAHIRQGRKNKPDPDLQVLISKLVLPSSRPYPR